MMMMMICEVSTTDLTDLVKKAMSQKALFSNVMYSLEIWQILQRKLWHKKRCFPVSRIHHTLHRGKPWLKKDFFANDYQNRNPNDQKTMLLWGHYRINWDIRKEGMSSILKGDKVVRKLWIITWPPCVPFGDTAPYIIVRPRCSIYPLQLSRPHAEILGMKTLEPPQNTFLTSSKKNCGIYNGVQWRILFWDMWRSAWAQCSSNGLPFKEVHV
jgi:hypothetical protein